MFLCKHEMLHQLKIKYIINIKISQYFIIYKLLPIITTLRISLKSLKNVYGLSFTGGNYGKNTIIFPFFS